jgi:hypothetical protein
MEKTKTRVLRAHKRDFAKNAGFSDIALRVRSRFFGGVGMLVALRFLFGAKYRAKLDCLKTGIRGVLARKPVEIFSAMEKCPAGNARRGPRRNETVYFPKQLWERPRRVAQRALFGLVFIIFFGVGPLAVNAQRYVEISGEIELLSYAKKTDANGAPIETRRKYPFTCITGTNEWRIDDEFVLNAREAWYSDGTNVYSSVHATKDIPEFPKVSTPGPIVTPMKVSDPVQYIRIRPSPGGHPLGDLGVNIPWLVYCSGSYLKKKGRVVPLPAVDLYGQIDGFAYTDKTQTFDDEFGLPQKVDLLTSEAQFRKSLDDERQIPNDRLERARQMTTIPFGDGNLKFRYTVEESTNFSGWTFPTKFNYTRFERHGGEWKPFVSGNGRLISIREGTKPTNVFVAGRPERIHDLRR